jgi:hypothetical protein
VTKAWIVAGVATLLAGANVAAWFAMAKPASGPKDPFWDRLEAVRLPGRSDLPPHFPEELRAREGTRVSVHGVAFVHPDGVEGDRVKWFVLMPPSRYGCCGISCDPRPELNVWVDCSASPWPANGKRQVLVTAAGRLRLEKGSASWCLTTLEDAVVASVEP